MAFYFRSTLRHLRHATLSLPNTEIVPHFSLPSDAITMFRSMGTNAMGYCSNKLSGVENCGYVESHVSPKKGKSRSSLKKGKTREKHIKFSGNCQKPKSHIAKLDISNPFFRLDIVKKKGKTTHEGKVSMENSVEPHFSVKKGEITQERKRDASSANAGKSNVSLKKEKGENFSPIYPQTLRQYLRIDERKEIADWEVMKLCKKERVYDILKFPPKVLRSDALLLQLFEAWLIENEMTYESNSEKMARFEDFKYNVNLYNDQNHRNPRLKYRLGCFADHKPGAMNIIDCRI